MLAFVAVHGSVLCVLQPRGPRGAERPLTDDEMDALATQEYGRDIGLRAKLAELDKLFKQAWQPNPGGSTTTTSTGSFPK